ncbi:hypothetical protein RB598_001786 [Gaeumannomyces tritici]
MSPPSDPEIQLAPDQNDSGPARPSSRLLRVAVTQAEPGWLDLQSSVDKTCSLIAEAAENGARILAFPECWIPGYPTSPEMDRILQASAEHDIAVALGFSERADGDSLYISQAVIDKGGILSRRRKIKPTHMERTIFGDAASVEELGHVVETSAGGGVRVGALSCWKHAQPLLKYHMCAQREQVHVAAWPPLRPHQGAELWSISKKGTRAMSQTYAIESQSFVLHATSVLTEKGISQLNTSSGLLFSHPGGGTSAVFGPNGKQLSKDHLDETAEGIIYADIDLDHILGAKAFLDVCGHYSRPNLL